MINLAKYLTISFQTHPVPHLWKYKEARRLFLEPPETVTSELTWSEPDEEALVRFLCHTKRVRYVCFTPAFLAPSSFLILVSFQIVSMFEVWNVFIVEWKTSVRSGKAGGRSGKEKKWKAEAAAKLESRTFLELPGRGHR